MIYDAGPHWPFLPPRPDYPLRTGKRGRPRIHPDRKAYKAEKERARRAKLKAEGKSK